MVPIVAFLVEFFSLLFLSILVHELGHLLYFEFVLKRKVKLRLNILKLRFEVGEEKDYMGLTNHERYGLSFSGLFCGMWIAPVLGNDIVVVLCVALLHVAGSWHDLKILKGLVQEEINV